MKKINKYSDIKYTLKVVPGYEQVYQYNQRGLQLNNKLEYFYMNEGIIIEKADQLQDLLKKNNILPKQLKEKKTPAQLREKLLVDPDLSE